MDFQGLANTKLRDVPKWGAQNVTREKVSTVALSWLERYRLRHFTAATSSKSVPLFSVIGGLFLMGYLLELPHLRAHAAASRYH